MQTTTTNPRQFTINVAGRIVTVCPQRDGGRVYSLPATDRRPVLVERDADGAWMLSMTGIKITPVAGSLGTVLLGDGISVDAQMWSAVSAM